MKRRTFIQLTFLVSFAVLFSKALFGENGKILKSKFKIAPPQIHVRHGMFNLQTALKDGFQVQPDIFTRDGVGVQANDRITSIKVSEGSKQSYLLLNNSASNIQPDNLNTIKLRANQSKHLQLKTGSIIFSELHEFKLDGIRLQADEAYRFNESHTINVESKKDQFLLIYHSK